MIILTRVTRLTNSRPIAWSQLGLLSNVVLVIVCGSLRAAEIPSSTGSVAGDVVYHFDSQRRWRLARYYVKGSQDGSLAEAVVALRAAGIIKDVNPREVETHTIDQKNFQFAPETIAIRARDFVKFTNSDREAHNVKSSGAVADFNVTMPPGGHYVHKFLTVGGIRRPARIGCAFHGAMRAWVFVFDHPSFQVTKSDGRFHFEAVPAGNYLLEMRHPAGGLRWSERIDVKPGVSSKIQINVSWDNRVAS